MSDRVIVNNDAEFRPALEGIALAIVGTVLFSMKSVVIKLAYSRGIDPETLMAGRYGIALPVYIGLGLRGWSQVQSDRRAEARRLVVPAAGLGILGYWLSSYLDLLGLQFVSAQIERVILFSYPLMVVALGYLLFRKTVARQSIFAALLSYVGLALLIVHEASAGSGDMRGIALVLGAAVSFAFYQLLAKPIIDRVGASIATAIMMCAACMASLLTLAVSGNWTSASLSVDNFAWMAILAIGGTVLPSIFMNVALSKITSQASAAIGGLGPVITIVLAFTFLDEQISTSDMVAMSLVLGGGLWFSFAEAR